MHFALVGALCYIAFMSQKHIEASRARWANVPQEKRSAIMRERAMQRLAKMDAKSLVKHAKMMVKARKTK
jgi:hypothetical protein